MGVFLCGCACGCAQLCVHACVCVTLRVCMYMHVCLSHVCLHVLCVYRTDFGQFIASPRNWVHIINKTTNTTWYLPGRCNQEWLENQLSGQRLRFSVCKPCMSQAFGKGKFFT